jgi:phenylpyruvate tautomerase PptA (4-oxalocrotonate tautomerase family)
MKASMRTVPTASKKLALCEEASEVLCDIVGAKPQAALLEPWD